LKNILLPITLIAAALLVSCQKDIEVVEGPFDPADHAILLESFDESYLTVPNYTSTADVPIHFASFGFGQQSRQTDYEIHLGRALFYDTRLSSDGTVSCASCHNQALGFADNKALSEGVSNNLTARNSQPINNIRAYYGDLGSGFFWDARATSLENQIEQSMTNPHEMGMTLSGVVQRVREVPAYTVAFKTLSATGRVDQSSVLHALAAFTRNISSTGSKFDGALDHKIKSESQSNFGFRSDLVEGNLNLSDTPAEYRFTEDELAGKDLYLHNCASCHSSQLPQRLDHKNNGLYAESDLVDLGVGAATGNASYNGWFKTPQLRNVALTAPYMHDGSMASLAEVIEHYSSGIAADGNISGELRSLTRNLGNGKRGFDFTEKEKEQLIDFLHTLTDYRLTQNPNLANPLKS
jgi:cytochrome c peroxidase